MVSRGRLRVARGAWVSMQVPMHVWFCPGAQIPRNSHPLPSLSRTRPIGGFDPSTWSLFPLSARYHARRDKILTTNATVCGDSQVSPAVPSHAHAHAQCDVRRRATPCQGAAPRMRVEREIRRGTRAGATRGRRDTQRQAWRFSRDDEEPMGQGRMVGTLEHLLPRRPALNVIISRTI